MNLIVIQEKIVNLDNIISIEKSKDGFALYFRSVSDQFVKFKYPTVDACDSQYQRLILMAEKVSSVRA